jgi:hypothetical protein
MGNERGHYGNNGRCRSTRSFVGSEADVMKKLGKIEDDQSTNFLLLLATVTLWGLAASRK